MLIKAVFVMILFVTAIGFTTPSGVNVIGIKNIMVTRSNATGLSSLLVAEQSFIQMNNTLPSLSDWKSDLRSTRSVIPNFAPYDISYNEESLMGRYFCLTATSPNADHVEMFLDIAERIDHLEPIIAEDCGETDNSTLNPSEWLSEDDINITIFTGN